jgi:septum formation protein
MRLVLASASPRRRELLTAAGWEFDVGASAIDETRQPGETPPAYVERMARAKAAAASAEYADGLAAHGDVVIVAADTAVVAGNEVLGKPSDAGDAARMLRLLSGRAHEVITGVAVAARRGTVAVVESTRVWFDALSDADIAAYVASGEPLDKAGAYGIQGQASRFIPRIEGSYTNVVGLPVATVARLIRAVTQA